jgi:two-component system response regulator MprA
MTRSLNILIAEDEAGIRDALGELLESEGHRCRLANDGQHAADALGAGERFDLLVSDFRMPRMDGVSLLHWCRQNGFHFPVIFITANRELFPLENEALHDCCAALLRKPIHIDEFLDAVTAAMERSHVRDCAQPPSDGEAGQPKTT